MRRYLLLPAFLLLFFGLIPSVHACQIRSQPETMNLSEIANNAATILVGEVRNITYGDDRTAWFVIVEVEVEQYLKGEGFSLIEISVFCSTHAIIDNRYIFFLNPSSEDSYIPAFPFEPYAYEPVIPATAENIAAIQAITGQSVPPQTLPFDRQLSRFLSKNWQLVGGTMLIVFALLGLLRFVKHRPERKAKMKRGE